MRRRQFLISSTALAWPLAARAQRSISFIGFLNSGSPNERAHLVEAFRGGLKEGGYVDGNAVAIDIAGRRASPSSCQSSLPSWSSARWP